MMKKITFIFIISTQLSFSQSKQETIEWIKAKIETYAYNSLNKNAVDLVEADECFITIYYTSHTNMGELKNIMKIPTEINGISEWMIVPNRNIDFAVYKQRNKKLKPVSRSYNVENTFPVYIREGEKDLQKRLLKAFRYLNSFCINKKETF